VSNPKPVKDRPVLIALIGAAATVLGSVGSGLGVYLVTRPDPSGDPPPVTLTMEESLEYTSPSTIQGHVSNLRPGMSVWTFNESFAKNDDVNPTAPIYANPGPCPVDSKGTWKCDSVYLGEGSKAVGHKFRIFAAVLSDDQAFQVVRGSLVNTYHGGPAIRGESTQPPHIQGVEVQTADVKLVNGK
jgi:hypothetical protein